MALGLVFVVIAAAIDGGLALSRVNARLEGAQTAFEDARNALRKPDGRAAAAALDQAQDRAHSAATTLDRISLALAGRLPLLGSDIELVRALSDVALALADAGVRATEMLGVEGSDGSGLLDDVFREGRIRLDRVEGVRERLEEIAAIVGAALQRLDSAPDARLDRLGEAVAATRRAVDRVLDELESVETAIALLQGFAGADEVRSYLVVFQSPSEARAGGGIAGVTAVLRLDQGGLRIEDAQPYSEFARDQRVPSPAWFRRTYGVFRADRQWPQANLALHFPTTAEVMLKMYEGATRDELDGLIAIDPIALRALLPALDDPLEAEGLEVPLDETNIVPVLLEESYRTFSDPRDQERVLLGLVDSFFDSLKTASPDGKLLVQGLSDALRTQHLKVYLRDPQLEDGLRALEVDGDYSTLGTRVQAHFTNTISANKVDYFLQQDIDVQVDVGGAGATVESTVRYVNTAPAGPPSVQLGPAAGFPDDPGTLRMRAAFLVPEGATVERFEVDGRAIDPFQGTELERRVVWDSLTIPPGGTTSLTVTYSMAAEEDGAFSLALWPQAVVTPAGYSIEVNAGEGTPAMSWNGSFYRTGILDRPVEIKVAFDDRTEG